MFENYVGISHHLNEIRRNKISHARMRARTKAMTHEGKNNVYIYKVYLYMRVCEKTGAWERAGGGR